MRSERKEKRYIRMLFEYLDKEKFENILVCSQDFHEDAYRDLVDSFEQVEMTRTIGDKDLKAIKEVRERKNWRTYERKTYNCNVWTKTSVSRGRNRNCGKRTKHQDGSGRA